MNDGNSDGMIALRPKARILKTLGDELISSNTIAIIELIKNSYDADAKNVVIEFSEIDGVKSIIVTDDGSGMSLDIVKQSWMTIATSNKKEIKVSTKKNRRVLGEKGIGRFATSKLSNELELISLSEGESKEVYVIFDWSQFDQNIFLDEVLFLTDEREPECIVEGGIIGEIAAEEINYSSGTVLRMNDLKDDWGSKDFIELERGLSRLVSPFNSINEFNIYIKRPEFDNCSLTKVEAPEIIKYPHYTIKGSVDADGKYFVEMTMESSGSRHLNRGYFYRKNVNDEWDVQPTNLSKDEITEEEFKLIECGKFEFELRVWDRDDLGNIDQKLGGGIRSIRKDLDSIAGINIYRDDFRVLPYGEPNNDWLRLDMRRVQTPAKRLSNNQITGYISITADDNPKLHDRSNREGLDNNSAYSDLEQIMIEILSSFEGERYIEKRNKNTKDKSKDGKNGENESGNLFDEPDFSSVISNVKSGDGDPKETLELLTKVELNWKEQIKNFKDVLSQYHSLATLGGIVDKVLHDGRQPLASIQTEAGLGKELSEDLVEDVESISLENLSEIEDGFARIVKQASIIRDVFNRVEPFGGRKKGRPKKYYIEELIKDNFDIYRKELKSAGVVVNLPETQTLVSLDITELSEIFTNLITNSIYWLGRVEKSNRSIHVDISRLPNGGLEILFADSGPGVKKSLRDKIFDPYVSDRSDGHGLGLCLVGEIIKNYYDGSIELLNTGDSLGAVFRLEMNKRV